jgi:hypothetical protein
MGELIKRLPAPAHQKVAHNVGCREINKIPVVDPSSAFQVEGVNALSAGVVLLVIFANKDQKSQKPLYVNRGLEQSFDFAHRHGTTLLANISDLGNRYSQEEVSLPILSWSCLEKPPKDFRLLRVFQFPQSFPSIFRCPARFHPLESPVSICQTTRLFCRRGMEF